MRGRFRGQVLGKSHRKLWYDAVITKASEAGYDLLFDDGDVEVGVPERFVKASVKPYETAPRQKSNQPRQRTGTASRAGVQQARPQATTSPTSERSCEPGEHRRSARRPAPKKSDDDMSLAKEVPIGSTFTLQGADGALSYLIRLPGRHEHSGKLYLGLVELDGIAEARPATVISLSAAGNAFDNPIELAAIAPAPRRLLEDILAHPPPYNCKRKPRREPRAGSQPSEDEKRPAALTAYEALCEARDEGLTLKLSKSSSGYQGIVIDRRKPNFTFHLTCDARQRLVQFVSRTEMPYGLSFKTAEEAALVLARSTALAGAREAQLHCEKATDVKNAPCVKYAPFLAMLDQRRRYLRAVRDARAAAGIESNALAGDDAHAPTEVLLAVACSDTEGDSDDEWHVVACIDSDEEAFVTAAQSGSADGGLVDGSALVAGSATSRGSEPLRDGPGGISSHAAAAERARAAAVAAATAAAANAEAPSGDTCCIHGCKMQLLRCHGRKDSGEAVGRAESGHVLCMPCLDRWFSSQVSLREERGLAPLSRRTCPVCMCPLRTTETHMRMNADQYALGLFKLPATW